jgi:hypothetical protein
MLGTIVTGLKSHPDVEQLVNVHYLADGITALMRTKDGNAYEVVIKPAKYGQYHDDYVGARGRSPAGRAA